MIDLSIPPTDLLEKAWKLSYADNEQATDFWFEVKERVSPFFAQENNLHSLDLIDVVMRASICFHAENYSVALELLQNNLVHLKTNCRIQLWLGRAYGLIGVTFRHLGDRALAAEYLLKRLEIGRKIGNKDLQRSSYNTLGNLYADSHEHEKAVEYFQLCIPLVREGDDIFLYTFCFSNLAESLIHLGRFDTARQYLDEVVKLTGADEYAFPRCIPLNILGMLENAQGNFESSLSYHQEADRLNERHGNDYTRIRILQSLGELFMAWGKSETAIEPLDDAIKICHRLGNRSLALPIYERLAVALFEGGQFERSAETYRILNKENSEIFREQTEFRVANLQVKYEAEAAQREAEILQRQNRILEEKVSQRTQDLENQRDKLERLNDQKNAVLTVLTHDMRAPLTTIGLHTELIRQRPELAAKKPHYLASINEAQKTLSELVKNILDLEKLEAGQPMALKLKLFNLTELTEIAVDQHLSFATKNEVSLNFSAENATVMINADRFQLQRVITNLITNAIKYTPAGKSVTVTVGKNDTHASIVVQDTGLGIEESLLDKIFIRYYRVETHKKRIQGAGLGLSIVKAIIDAHDGSISVQSEPNHGSRFTVLLPLA